MLDYQLTSFSNGLKVITAPMKNTKAVTVLFLIGVGSRYEDKNLNGISHFLEHMVFKGTKKRPTVLDISMALDSVGASYNAFTTEEYTGFYVRAASEHFDLALDIIFDVLYNAKFDPAEIDKEKGVIAEEINMYQDNPQIFIAELAKEVFYGAEPLGMQVTGKKETISQFKRADFINWRDRHYTPDNMVVVVAGGENGDWLGKIKQFFDKLTISNQGSYQKIKENQVKPESLVSFKQTDQAHLVIGFRSIPRKDSRRPILKVLNNLFGENMSSRLFIEVREKRGLAYYVSSDLADFHDTGAFAVSCGVDINRAEDAIKVILDEFEKLKKSPIPDSELKRAQENLKGRMYLSLEESFAVADFLADQELLYGKIEDPDDLIEQFKKVTAVDVQKFAREFLVKENLNLAVIGPFKEKQKFQKIIERYQ